MRRPPAAPLLDFVLHLCHDVWMPHSHRCRHRFRRGCGLDSHPRPYLLENQMDEEERGAAEYEEGGTSNIPDVAKTGVEAIALVGRHTSGVHEVLAATRLIVNPVVKEIALAEGPSCIFMGPIETTSKDLLKVLYLQVYHSSFVNEEGITKACGCPLLPLKSHIKGPAPVSDQGALDIVDEAITFFRANVFFRNFDVKSSADKLLIYLTLYINIALKRLEGCRTLAEGTKAIINLGLEKVPVPGEPGFPFGGLFAPPESQEEAELFRNYLKQIREETSGRLLSCTYRSNGTPNKWWLAFSKRKFMNIIVPHDPPDGARRLNMSIGRLNMG